MPDVVCFDRVRLTDKPCAYVPQTQVKRIGEKSVYMRSLPGFFRDIGMGYLTEGEPKRIRESLKRTVYPALDLLKNIDYRLDDPGNLVFIPRD
jgi:hypothetical protein